MPNSENLSPPSFRPQQSHEFASQSLHESRRALLKGGLAAALLGPAVAARALGAASPAIAPKGESRKWGSGPEGQRVADRGDGTFLNPIMPGDHPDPTILKDGADYYMTFSSF